MSTSLANLQVANDEDFEDQDERSNASPSSSAAPQDVGGVAGKRLQAFIERIERLEGEKAALMEDIKEVYAEAKGVGFDVKTIRKIVSLRKVDAEKRREADDLLELYKAAIGLV